METNMNNNDISTKLSGKRGRKKKDQLENNEHKNLVESIVDNVNEGIKKNKISKDVVISYALSKLTEADFSKLIKDHVVDNEDRIHIKFLKFKKQQGNENADFWDFVASEMKLN